MDYNVKNHVRDFIYGAHGFFTMLERIPFHNAIELQGQQSTNL
jgi:hypothetical protein